MNQHDSGRASQLLTVGQVAARLGVSIRTVWSWIALGKIQVVRLSRRATRVSVASLERFLEQCRG